jgi:hypothetical protein
MNGRCLSFCLSRAPSPRDPDFRDGARFHKGRGNQTLSMCPDAANEAINWRATVTPPVRPRSVRQALGVNSSFQVNDDQAEDGAKKGGKSRGGSA